MTQQTMTKEQILESRISCTCNEAYKTRQMSDPDCGRCNWYEEILSCMEEYKEHEVAKERKKAKKLVEALGSAISTLEGLEMYNTCETIKQSLTEYEKL